MLEREEISNPLMALVKKTFIHPSISTGSHSKQKERCRRNKKKKGDFVCGHRCGGGVAPTAALSAARVHT